MKQNEAFNPLSILRFSANAVVLHAQLVADSIEELGGHEVKRGLLGVLNYGSYKSSVC